MEWLNELISERPIMFIRYIGYIAIFIAMVFTFLQNKRKKEPLTQTQTFQTTQENPFFDWITEQLLLYDLNDVIAFNFNLYDDGDNNWSVELVGTKYFNETNSDWACAEVFATRKKPYKINHSGTFNDVLNLFKNGVQSYISTGKKRELLKSKAGVGIGFVDGDLEIIYKNPSFKHLTEYNQNPIISDANNISQDPVDKNRHSKIIKELAKEILEPIGIFQKGNSRIYFDDNGYYLTMVEFQPSAWSRGTYLNVGVHFLWNVQDDDGFSFDAYLKIHRVGNFIEYKNDEQFRTEVREHVMLAKEQILLYRDDLNILRCLDKRNASCHTLLNKAFYSFYRNTPATARLEYQKFLENEYSQELIEYYSLPTNPDEINHDFVINAIKKRRRKLHSKPNMKKLPYDKNFD